MNTEKELNYKIKQDIDCLVQKFFDNEMSHQECRSEIINLLSGYTLLKTEYDKYMEYVDSILSERQLALPIF